MNIMKKIMMFLICILLSGAYCFSAEDDFNCFYADSADQIPEWWVKMDYLAVQRDDGTIAEIITSPTDYINIASANVGEVADYFVRNISLPPGTYDTILFQQGEISTFKGCIQIGDDTWRATGQGNTEYLTKAAALAAATEQIFTFGEVEYEELSVDPITIEDGKTYTLQILWTVAGAQRGIEEEGEDPTKWYGNGLLWDENAGEFIEGMLAEEYIVIEE